jgi:hypothetical protein
MKSAKKSRKSGIEPRDSEDRRGQDEGPPKGWLNRRHHVERRLPVVEETEMSASDFERYFVNGKSTEGEKAVALEGAQPAATAEKDERC